MKDKKQTLEQSGLDCSIAPEVAEDVNEQALAPEAIKKRKNFTSLKAWQRGHELNLELAQILSEYQSDPELRDWCRDAQSFLKESCVQLMEAYRKFQAWEKVRRYECALFFINKAYYHLFLGQELGLWSVADLLEKIQDYYHLTCATMLCFVDKSEKANKAKNKAQDS